MPGRETMPATFIIAVDTDSQERPRTNSHGMNSREPRNARSTRRGGSTASSHDAASGRGEARTSALSSCRRRCGLGSAAPWKLKLEPMVARMACSKTRNLGVSNVMISGSAGLRVDEETPGRAGAGERLLRSMDLRNRRQAVGSREAEQLGKRQICHADHSGRAPAAARRPPATHSASARLSPARRLSGVRLGVRVGRVAARRIRTASHDVRRHSPQQRAASRVPGGPARLRTAPKTPLT